MSAPLRRSSRKRKCTEFSGFCTGTVQSKPRVKKIVEETCSSKEESAIPNQSHVQCPSSSVVLSRLPMSTSKLSPKPKAATSENKSPVTAIHNPVNFYGKSSQNWSFSEDETTINAAVVLQNAKPNLKNRILVCSNSNTAQMQKPKQKSAPKKGKLGTKSLIKNNPQKFASSTFMKKSLLEMHQPQIPQIDEPVTKSTPPKRKFFNSSSKQKINLMTTTLFGKQRISAATILNKPVAILNEHTSSNIVMNIPRVPMKVLSQASSSLSPSSKKSTRSSKTCQTSPHKETTLSKSHSQSGMKDFLDSIDEMLLQKPRAVTEDLQSLNSTLNSLASSNKENDSACDSINSNHSELHVPDMENLHIDSPSPRAFIQHYHYSPSPNVDASENDLPASNINSLSDKSSSRTPSPVTKRSASIDCRSTGSDAAGSPTLTSTPEISLYRSPLSSTAISRPSKSREESAWPIRYSRESEKLSKLKSKPRSTRSLLPAFKNSHLKSIDGKEQLIIDAGQNKIGAQMCNECGMLYDLDAAEDVGLHVKFHNTLITNLRFQGWKKERVVRDFNDGRVLLVLPEDPKYALKKVSDVKSIMNANLGFHEKAQPDQYTMQVYFYVIDKKIVGCLIAEAIKQAFRVIPMEGNGPLSCSTSPEDALCGVNRIWTLAAKRRCHIASRLVDCMRTRFYFGCEVTIDQIAFSDPTPDGRQFAANYTCSENFLVYK